MVALILAAGMPLTARAESGRLNLHASGGAILSSFDDPIAIGAVGYGGLDWQFSSGYALDLRAGGGLANAASSGADFHIVDVAGGLRLRFLDNQLGYGDEIGGDQWGNLFVVPRVGYLQRLDTGERFATVEAEVGYEFSVARPLQIGVFARPTLAVGTDGGNVVAIVTTGVCFSIELFARRRPPKPATSVEPASEPIDDTDEDGVPDDLDACPGTLRQKVDARGCVPTPTTPPPLTLQPEMVLAGITFELNSASILPTSEPALARAAELLRAHPEVRVEVGGHTCDLGGPTYHQQLSEARARAVADWLAAHGIEHTRLVVHGYGDTRPIEPNDSDQHRARNRRIEFTPLDALPVAPEPAPSPTP